MSTTMPGPITFTTPSRSTPEGSRFKIKRPFSFTTVCPALLPP